MTRHRWKIALLLPYLLIFINYLKGQKQDSSPPTLLAGPSSVNASVNSNVTFSCTFSNADIVEWRVNGRSINTVHNLVVQGSPPVCVDECMNKTYMYNIAFTIEKSADLSQLNNSNIICAGYQESLSEFSTSSLPALLLIQGVLSSPTLQYSEIANGSMWMRWNAPYTLLGVKIDWYYVNITISTLKTTSNQSFKAYVEECSFEAVDSCAVYEVGIQAVTLAGLGQQASTSISRTEAPESLSQGQVKVDVSLTDEWVLLIFKINQTDCPGRYATSAVIDIYLQEGVLHSEVPYIDDSKGMLVQTVEVPIMNKRAVKNFTITLSNSAGSTLSESIKLDLSCLTFYMVSQSESKKMVSCEFGLNCDIKNCVVVLQSEKRSGVPNGYFFILERQENSTMSEVITLDCGSDYQSTCANTILTVFTGLSVEVSDNVNGIPLGNCCIAKIIIEPNSGVFGGFSLFFFLQDFLIVSSCCFMSGCCSLVCIDECTRKRDNKKRK